MQSLTAEEQAYAKYVPELVSLTGMTTQEIDDFLTCSPEQQVVIAQSYRDLDWVQNPDTFGKVLAVLEIIGTIAGVVAGVAGAVTAVSALRAL